MNSPRRPRKVFRGSCGAALPRTRMLLSDKCFKGHYGTVSKCKKDPCVWMGLGKKSVRREEVRRKSKEMPERRKRRGKKNAGNSEI